MTSQKQYTPFYKTTWFITAMVILFWPVGLILMWLWAKCSRLTKILITGSLLFVIIFNLTTSFVIRPVFSSGSMMPTIGLNKRGVVNQFAYIFQPPQRGDIVIFSPTPALRSQNFKGPLIKRIIGLPGEMIEVSDGQVYIKG